MILLIAAILLSSIISGVCGVLYGLHRAAEAVPAYLAKKKFILLSQMYQSGFLSDDGKKAFEESIAFAQMRLPDLSDLSNLSKGSKLEDLTRKEER